MPELHELSVPIAIISVAMGIWFLLNITRYLTFKKLIDHGMIAQGVITEVETFKLVMGVKLRREEPKLRYRFLTGMGTEIMSAKKEIPLLMRSREEQDVISITYLPEDPDVNHMSEDLKLHLRGLYYWLFVPLVGWFILVTPMFMMTLLSY